MSRSQLGRALSIKTGQAKQVSVFLTDKISMDVYMQQKDTLKDALKFIETHRKIKIETGSVQFKTFDGMVIKLDTMARSLTVTELYLSPPLNLDDRNKIFGKPLVDLMKGKKELPSVITKCFEFLEKERALRSVGLFRLNGLKAEISKIKHQLDDQGDEFDIPTNTDPHVITSIVKKYLRSLPTPIIPTELYDEFLKLADTIDEDQRCQQIKTLLKKIPTEHYRCLRYMLEYLVRLCMYSNKNLITPNVIAIVFGSLILREPSKEEKSQTQKLEEIDKRKREKIYQRLSPAMKFKYMRTIAIMIDNFGVVFGLKEEDINQKVGNVPSVLDAPNETVKNVLAMMKQGNRLSVAMQKQLQLPQNTLANDIDDTPAPLTSRRTRRVGTIIQAPIVPSLPLSNIVDSMLNSGGNTTPRHVTPRQEQSPAASALTTAASPAQPAAAPIDPEIQKTLTKAADEWKKKFMDEANGRLSDKETYLKERREWDELRELDERQIKNLKDEIEFWQKKVKLVEDKYKEEAEKLKRDCDSYREQQDELKAQHAKEIQSLRTEHATLLRKYGIESNSIGSQVKPRDYASSTISNSLASSYTSQSELTNRATSPQPSSIGDDKKPSINVSSRFKRDIPASQSPVPEEIDPSKMCGACKKYIHGQYFEAGDKKYHNECFACTNCKKLIKGAFADRGEGQLWCKSCLQAQKKPASTPAAKSPEQPINHTSSPSSPRVAVQQPNVVPAVNSIPTPKISVADPKKVVCSTCDDIIEPGDKIAAMGKIYHKGCFRCQKCGSEFENMKFYALDNLPVCATCKRNAKK